MLSTKNLLDSSVLQQTIVELIGGDVTFLEAFDRTGRVLNITVTRSDGKAPPLLCNYLTTPQLLVHSACHASCAIPGIFAPVQLMGRDRTGAIRPYFTSEDSAGWRFTDGGLQADLPKRRLTELFNVNQFVISQVNPLPPSWCKAPAALLEDSPRSICPPGASQDLRCSSGPRSAASAA